VPLVGEDEQVVVHLLRDHGFQQSRRVPKVHVLVEQTMHL
jgi:hypothetical protein